MDQLDALAIGVAVGVVGVYGVRWLWRRTRPRKVVAELREFFKTNPYDLPIVNRSFATVDLPNLHLAITQHTERLAAKTRVIGYSSPFGEHDNSLRSLMRGQVIFERITVGPVSYREVDVDVDRQMQCVENAIHLIASAEQRVAAHVRRDVLRGGLDLEVMAGSPELAANFIEQVRSIASQSNVYRRKIISLECDSEGWGARGWVNVRFHRFAPVRREEIVLPAETIDVIERNTVRFFQYARLLRSSNRSLKRGLLFHGKPGTGKTYTARWLAQSLDGVTVILLSGEQLWLIKQCCQMARMLAPSLVIMEDVDLIATQRDERRHPMYQITLHQLLNEMDGLASDAEVILLLTTNRPDMLEPALAARPGRIDQAIEFPLPDADSRRRLLELYGRGLYMDLKEPQSIIARTHGASPAFIQELVRKASLIAAEAGSLRDGTLQVSDSHLDLALRELVLGGGDLTRSLLGFAAQPLESH